MARSSRRACRKLALAWATALVVCAVAASAGCAPPADAQPKTEAPVLGTGACAERLHDVCGRLLLYYAANRRLPDSLSELSHLGEPVEMTCPTSADAYVYNREGILLSHVEGMLIIYDATPVHGGLRWGVVVVAPAQGGPTLTTKVVGIPEAQFNTTK